MHISGTNQYSSIETQYISSNGYRKTLASANDDSVRAFSVKRLCELECQICYEVHEKPLLTKCCELVICASCYLSLPSPKTCPFDREAFKGSAKDDLKVAGRLINNQIEAFIANFNDVQSTEADTEKSQKQNNVIKQLVSSSAQSTTNQPARQNPGNTNIGAAWASREQSSSSDDDDADYIYVGDVRIYLGNNRPVNSRMTIP